jgi:Fur family ferric uptake transcriptional regulator
MSDTLVQLKDTLKRNGYSLTTARRTVFEALQSQPPRSMRELATDCLPAINRASLYRTIELFERLDIVHRLHIGWKYKLELSDAFQPHHHHAICTVCGVIVTLPEDEAIERRLAEMATQAEFALHEHQLELRGKCRDCVNG